VGPRLREPTDPSARGPAMENSVCHHNGNFVGLVLCGVKALSWTEANIGNGSRDGFPVGGGVVALLKAVSSVE
jgi:hypothetical protein